MTELVGSSDGDYGALNTQTVAGQAQTNTGTSNNKSGSNPDRRLYNPLSQFASYTYNISLYMITPEAYDAFIQTGRKNIYAFQNASGGASANLKAGVYLIAQSGGVNNSTQKRAPGFEFDYYIDNLKLVSAVQGASTGTSTNVTSISFNVYEQYGFSFINNLKKAQDALQAYVAGTGRAQKGLQNPTRQFFILGLRFIGYDKLGNIVDSTQDTLNVNTANNNGLFETFYDIALTEVKFKLTGKVVTYEIKAASVPSKEAFGTKRGLIDLGANFEASNAYEAIQKIIDKLNQDQQNLVNQSPQAIKIADRYEVEYLGGMDDLLKAATVASKADLQKYTWAGSGATNVSQSNDAAALKATPNSQTRTFSIQGTTPIVQAINQIISQSTYLLDALKVVYTTNVEPNLEKKTENEQQNNKPSTVSWYNISAVISNMEWDESRADFAMKIKYIITPYETPVIQNSYTAPGSRYYGPHKRYKYWYTGENQEIIFYEQVLNTAFFNVALKPEVSDSQGKGGAVDVPIKANQRQNQPHIGKLDVGAEAQNAYLTNLFDPKGFAEAKITILGDPDFLMPDSELPQSVQEVYNRFYGPNGFTVKANGGQVFIEIDFKEGVDYNTNTGLYDINSSVLFWRYPENVSKVIQGVSYHVIKVTSSFSNGKFTQVLDCRINTFSDPAEESSSQREATTQQTPNAPGTNASGSNTTGSTGLKNDPTFVQKLATETDIKTRSSGSNTTANDDNDPNLSSTLPGA